MRHEPLLRRAQQLRVGGGRLVRMPLGPLHDVRAQRGDGDALPSCDPVQLTRQGTGDALALVGRFDDRVDGDEGPRGSLQDEVLDAPDDLSGRDPSSRPAARSSRISMSLTATRSSSPRGQQVSTPVRQADTA